MTSIVIDAGHGGLDSGAYKNEVKEKDINLQVATSLALMLGSHGYKVIETRTRDVYLTLPARCKKSNDAAADYFISIHCNSALNKAANGCEVWYHEKSTVGKHLAQCIQSEIVKTTGVNDRGIKPTNSLWVIKHTAAPAVLIELGFLSNEQECERLQTTEYQTMLVTAISEGLSRFFTP